MSDPTIQQDSRPEIEISEDERMLAILAYVPILCLIPFTRTERSEFVSGHVRHGITLFVIEIFALVLRLLPAVWDVIIFLCVVAALFGIYHVARGQSFSLPYLSEFLKLKR